MDNFQYALNAIASRLLPNTFFIAILLFLGIWNPANAQVPISISPNPAEAPGLPPWGDGLAQAFLTHQLNNTVTYRWTRTVVVLEGGQGCISSVLDKYISYAPFISTRTFELGPNEANFPLFIALYNTDTIPCCALIHLKINAEGDTANTITAAYLFGTCVSSAPELSTLDTQIQPNPVISSFSISGKTAGTRVQLFDLQGRLVQSWDASVENYLVPLLPAGTYVLVLLDEKAGPYRALQFVKR